MIRLYIRAINSKDKVTLLNVAQDAKTYYIDSYQKRYPYYSKRFQTFVNTHNALKECWIIVSNSYGRTFNYSKFWTGLNFLSLPFFVVYKSKEEAISTLFHYFFFNICPVSDISTKIVKDIFQVQDRYVDISASLLLSFCEVMNIRLFVNENKKMNLLEIFCQTLLTSYCLRSVSMDFTAIEKYVSNKLFQYVLKRLRLTIISSFISLICSIGFSNGMRVTFEEWLFSLFKLFKTHFDRQIIKASSEISNSNPEEINDEVEIVNQIDVNYIHVNYFTENHNQTINKLDNNDSDIFINILNNGKLCRHLIRLDGIQQLSAYDSIKNSYFYKVNFVIPPKQLQCSICHHLLQRPVESYGYFFCNNCIKKYIRQHINKEFLKSSSVKNPITGDPITEKSFYISPFMSYIVYRYKLFLLNDCVEEYKIEQTKKNMEIGPNQQEK